MAPGKDDQTGAPEKSGVLFALAAYVSWGVFPAYWKLLGHVPAREILAHRIVWSSVMFVGMLALLQARPIGASWKSVLARARAHWRGIMVCALLIGSNWYVYIYAVTSGQILESSLGYFINPLVNVSLGVLFLKERLSRLQKIAVGLALIGVLMLALQGPSFPKIALFLAFTFGFYGLTRKKLPLGAIEASALESLILALPAAVFILALLREGESQYSSGTFALLGVGGVVTGLPLLFFAAAARRLPLSTLGFFQYLAPSLQFALAVFAYGETFTWLHARSFAFIWTALAIYSLDLLQKRRAGRRLSESPAEFRTSAP